MVGGDSPPTIQGGLIVPIALVRRPPLDAAANGGALGALQEDDETDSSPDDTDDTDSSPDDTETDSSPDDTDDTDSNPDDTDSDSRGSGRAGSTQLHWPRVPLHHVAAAEEFPFCKVTRKEADRAHGVANDNIPEVPEVAALRRLMFRNDPPLRRAAPAVPQQQPHRRKDGSEFQPSKLEDLMVTFTFYAHKHGRHVALRLREEGELANSGWRLTPTRFWDEVVEWGSRARRQVAIGKRLAAEGNLSVMRWLYDDWLIPEAATQPLAKRRIYEVVEAMAARQRGEESYAVPLADLSEPGPVWNETFFEPLFKASHYGDRLTGQVIGGRGVVAPYTGSWDSMLCRNAATLYEELAFIQKTLRAEVEEGLMSPTSLGIQTWPAKVQPLGVARIFRRGKAKNRGTMNATGKGRPMQFKQAFSNNGWLTSSLRHFPDREWNSAMSFSNDVYICRTAFEAHDFCIRGADWHRFYRQVKDHPLHNWMFQCVGLEEGFARHLRKFFGDLVSVIPCILCQDGLIWALRWLLMVTWKVSEIDDCSEWVRTLLHAKWMTRRSRLWVERRARVFATPGATSWRRLSYAAARREMHKFWNLVPLAIGAFFDDEFSGSGKLVQRDVTDCIITIIREGDVEGSLEKFYSVDAGGASFSLVHDEGAPPEVQTWQRDEEDGPADVLGRGIVLSDTDVTLDKVEDRPAAVLETVALTLALIQAAHDSKTRQAPVPAGERVFGQWGWLVGTREWLRSLLQSLKHALCVRPTKHRARPLARRHQKFEMGHAAFASVVGGKKAAGKLWDWRRWGMREYFTLSHAAEADLRMLISEYEAARARACMPRRSPVALGDICFILNDNAGLQLKRRPRRGLVVTHGDGNRGGDMATFEEKRQKRAGAAFLYMHGHAEIPFVQERWLLDALRNTHSTQGEMANGAANLDLAVSTAPFNRAKVFWEVYDSSSSQLIWHKMKAKRQGMQAVLGVRRNTIRKLQQRGARVLTSWCSRELLQISDHLSKYCTKEARRMLQQRFPHSRIARRALRRKRNVLNRRGAPT